MHTHCYAQYMQANQVALAHTQKTNTSSTVRACFSASIIGYTPLQVCHRIHHTQSDAISACILAHTSSYSTLHTCQYNALSSTQTWTHCYHSSKSALVHRYSCYAPRHASTHKLHSCTMAHFDAVRHIAQCQTTHIAQASAVLCRYYPIIEIAQDPIKDDVCAPIPPSQRLPLSLGRKNRFNAKALPLALGCYASINNPSTPITPTPHTPTLGHYIMHHTITASVGNIAIDPLDFSASTDMASFCYGMSIQISSEDYAKIKHLFAAPRGQEPVVTVRINDIEFAFLGEEISHTRQFAHTSVSIAGRSKTAHLAKEYALAKPLAQENLYASQIVNVQLENLPIDAQFGVEDWLIDPSTYSAQGKTPIAVLDDIAKACGGFIYSDTAKPMLYLIPRYKVAAWDIASTNADHITSLAPIIKMSITKRNNPRYNSIALVGATQGGVVHRASEGRDKPAPVSSNPLYQQRECIVKAGIALLSDSGNHSTIQIDTKMSIAHDLPMASLGQIWQVNDDMPTGAWRGVVVGVAIEASVDDGVVVVNQRITLDRYDDV